MRIYNIMIKGELHGSGPSKTANYSGDTRRANR
jgi:hypothetical protein